jgi:uncharacterized protein YjiK
LFEPLLIEEINVSKKLSTLFAFQLTLAIVLSQLPGLSIQQVQAVPSKSLTAPARFSSALPSVSSVDLSTYVRIGRHDLPEPTRTIPPANSLLAQEASGVTYNWDTNTLFVVADGGTSVVQITKTGQLIDSMTLSPGGSPQGTDFYDPEGISYVGNGKFVMSEERDRQIVLFTYAAGTTLTRSGAQTVKLGTFVQNIGIEGVSWDPLTSGYVCVKETLPQGIFQTGIDFDAGTATNGSPSTVNSINLFNPALVNLADFADVFALSNLPSLSGQPDFDHLLVLSQESGKIVNVNRSGNISNSLTIVSDPGNPLSVAAQQHEGLTMDRDGILYVVSENGGGDFDHPQLWVYAPSLVPNQPPTAVALNNSVNSIMENTSTTSAIKVADIIVTDDGLGTNNLTVSGVDAGFFEITGTSLYIKAGTVLDFETKSSYSITINVDDPTLGSTPDASVGYTLTVINQEPETPPVPSLIISEVAPWSSGNSPVSADWFEVTNTGSSAVNITGWKMDDNSNSSAASVLLNGITSIAPGESVIFLESTAANPPATIIASFRSVWFGLNVPAALQIGTYQGGGVGLSTGGDAVNLYNSSGALQANVSFGASPAGPSFPTFDNWAGLNNATISLLSVVGVHDAFAAAGDTNEIGSPGAAGRLIISEVAPWSSGNSPVGADWFEVTNTRSTPVNISGWKMDDNSGSPAAAVSLNGITNIGPGESVIFLESSAPATVISAFKSLWFGENVPANLQIGTYSGAGVGLGTGGDAVSLYNSGGVLQANVAFGSSPAGPSFPTFDNAAGRNNTTISQLSIVGVNGAFAAASDTNEIGSPGTIAAAPTPVMVAAGGTLINESCASNSQIDPGERVSVNLSLTNIGTGSTSNLVATLHPGAGVLAPSNPRTYGVIAPAGAVGRDFSFTADPTLTSGQTITATLQLQDGAANLGTVTFNFTAGSSPCGGIRLVISSSALQRNGGTVTTTVTVENIGTLPADNVNLTSAMLGSTGGVFLSPNLGTIQLGASASTQVSFTTAATGSALLKFNGSYGPGIGGSGTLGSTKRVIIP